MDSKSFSLLVNRSYEQIVTETSLSMKSFPEQITFYGNK